MKELQLVSAHDASTSFNSIGCQKGDLKDYSIQVVFSSATLNGTLTIEASNDNSNYVTISGTSQSIASGAGHMYNVTDANYKFFRLAWAATSGTGTLTANVTIIEPTNRA